MVFVGVVGFSTFGWNGAITETADLSEFSPTDVLVTGRDIIFLWVSRMMMTTKKFVNKVAFEDCVVTGTVLGKDGKPMSKSRGNGVDPLDMFDKFGVDATRIYLASIATGADIRWNDMLIETYRNFANKIWNATRFCLLNSEGARVDAESLRLGESASIADKWIVSRLNKTAMDVNKALEKYEFHAAVSLLYHFSGAISAIGISSLSKTGLPTPTRAQRMTKTNCASGKSKRRRPKRGRESSRSSNNLCGCFTRLCRI